MHLPRIGVGWQARRPVRAGEEMTFLRPADPHLQDANVRAGSIVGSGTVSNRTEHYSCIAEKRAIETIEGGAPRTEFMRWGDKASASRCWARRQSLFGAIECPLQGSVKSCPATPSPSPRSGCRRVAEETSSTARRAGRRSATAARARIRPPAARRRCASAPVGAAAPGEGAAWARGARRRGGVGLERSPDAASWWPKKQKSTLYGGAAAFARQPSTPP